MILRLIMCVLLGTSALAHGVDWEFEIVSEGVLDGHQGFYQQVSFDDSLHETDFLIQEGQYIRWYAFKMSHQDSFTVLPEGRYIAKLEQMSIGDTWSGWIGGPTVASVVDTATVTAPAGTFFCYVIEQRPEADPDSVIGKWWLSENLGWAMAMNWGQENVLQEYAVMGSGFYPLAVGNRWLLVPPETPVERRNWGWVKTRFGG
jgi:hypothetical protein